MAVLVSERESWMVPSVYHEDPLVSIRLNRLIQNRWVDPCVFVFLAAFSLHRFAIVNMASIILLIHCSCWSLVRLLKKIPKSRWPTLNFCLLSSLSRYSCSSSDNCNNSDSSSSSNSSYIMIQMTPGITLGAPQPMKHYASLSFKSIIYGVKHF